MERAAGLGMRMRPLAADTPKPLVRLLGRTLLDRVLDHLEAAGVERIVVNVHYKAEIIERHLTGRPNILLSRESSLLETGGGVAKALPDLGAEPFFRSEEHTSELQSLMRISYAVFCLKKKKKNI